ELEASSLGLAEDDGRPLLERRPTDRNRRFQLRRSQIRKGPKSGPAAEGQRVDFGRKLGLQVPASNWRRECDMADRRNHDSKIALVRCRQGEAYHAFRFQAPRPRHEDGQRMVEVRRVLTEVNLVTR